MVAILLSCGVGASLGPANVADSTRRPLVVIGRRGGGGRGPLPVKLTFVVVVVAWLGIFSGARVG